MNGDTKAAMALFAAVAWIPVGTLACESAHERPTAASTGQLTATAAPAASFGRRDDSAKTAMRATRYTWPSYRSDDLDDGYIKVEYFRSSEAVARSPQKTQPNTMSERVARASQGRAQETGMPVALPAEPKAAPAATRVNWAAP